MPTKRNFMNTSLTILVDVRWRRHGRSRAPTRAAAHDCLGHGATARIVLDGMADLVLVIRDQRWDETWHRLREWTNGQAPAERLAAQILLSEGYTGLDPRHPLGGRDAGADAVLKRHEEPWIMAVYFPRGQQTYKTIHEKFKRDFEGVGNNDARGMVFVTNQELRHRERRGLAESVGASVDIYHLERLVAILDQPSMGGVRQQFLGIELDVSGQETSGHYGTSHHHPGVPAQSAELEASEIQARSLPHSYDPPLTSDESGFVFRTVTALAITLPPDAHFTSQQKRRFQSQLCDCSIEGMVQELLHHPLTRRSPPWNQAQPNTGRAVTVVRPAEAMRLTGGTIEVRSGLQLPSYGAAATRAILHIDLVFRLPAEMKANSLLSLDDFYSLLRIPPAAARDEIAPAVTAMLAEHDEPMLVGQSVVALPYRSDFSTYLDLSLYANDRAADASGPLAVHWTGASRDEIETAEAWKGTVLKMIERLFSDGSFVDYEHSLQRLSAS